MSISPIDHQVHTNATVHLDKIKSEEARQAHMPIERTDADEKKHSEEMKKIQDVENSDESVTISDEDESENQQNPKKQKDEDEDEEAKKIEEENEKRWGKPKNPVTAPGERRGKLLDIVT
jgi:hypothetical protein